MVFGVRRPLSDSYCDLCKGMSFTFGCRIFKTFKRVKDDVINAPARDERCERSGARQRVPPPMGKANVSDPSYMKYGENYTSTWDEVPRREDSGEPKRVPPPMGNANVLDPSQEEHMAKVARDTLRAKLLKEKK